MTVTIEFEESGKKYTVDFLKLSKQLNITEEQIKQAVQDVLSKNG
jgi:hypothetical protein